MQMLQTSLWQVSFHERYLEIIALKRPSVNAYLGPFISISPFFKNWFSRRARKAGSTEMPNEQVGAKMPIFSLVANLVLCFPSRSVPLCYLLMTDFVQNNNKNAQPESSFSPHCRGPMLSEMAP